MNISDWDFAKLYTPAFTAVVASLSIFESTFEQDTQEATDLVLINGYGSAIACRVRRPGYHVRYPFDFTIRTDVPLGGDTEMDKVLSGYADWFLYGHATADENDRQFERWFALDMNVFRAKQASVPRIHHINYNDRGVPDGTEFDAFHLVDFPPELVIKGTHPIPYPVVYGKQLHLSF